MSDYRIANKMEVMPNEKSLLVELINCLDTATNIFFKLSLDEQLPAVSHLQKLFGKNSSFPCENKHVNSLGLCKGSADCTQQEINIIQITKLKRDNLVLKEHLWNMVQQIKKINNASKRVCDTAMSPRIVDHIIKDMVSKAVFFASITEVTCDPFQYYIELCSETVTDLSDMDIGEDSGSCAMSDDVEIQGTILRGEIESENSIPHASPWDTDNGCPADMELAMPFPSSRKVNKGSKDVDVSAESTRRACADSQELKGRKRIRRIQGMNDHQMWQQPQNEVHSQGNILSRRRPLDNDVAEFERDEIVTSDDKFVESNESEHDFCEKPDTSKMECRLCLTLCNSKASLLSHLAGHGNGACCCIKCRKPYGNYAFYLVHLCDNNNGRLDTRRQYGLPRHCRLCGVTFRNVNKLQTHMTQCHKQSADPDFFCKKCNKGFVKKSNLMTHLKIHAGDQIVCTRCGAFVATIEDYRTHLRTHKAVGSFVCGACDTAFTDRDDCLDHLDNHVVYRCPQCDTSFLTRRCLHKHDLHDEHDLDKNDLPRYGASPVTKDFKYKCGVCDKSFIRPNHLETHIRLHTGEKPIRCETCEINFRTKKALARHLETFKHLHSAGSDKVEKKHLCSQCGKAYFRKQALQRHMMYHNETKPHCCPHCNYRSRESNNLKRHLALHFSRRDYVCEVCGAAFHAKRTLQTHVTSVHSSERGHQCPQCPRSFKTPSTLRRHAKIHCAEKPHRCSGCSAQFKRLSNLRRHVAARHQGQVTLPPARHVQLMDAREGSEGVSVGSPPGDRGDGDASTKGAGKGTRMKGRRRHKGETLSLGVIAGSSGSAGVTQGTETAEGVDVTTRGNGDVTGSWVPGTSRSSATFPAGLDARGPSVSHSHQASYGLGSVFSTTSQGAQQQPQPLQKQQLQEQDIDSQLFHSLVNSVTVMHDLCPQPMPESLTAPQMGLFSPPVSESLTAPQVGLCPQPMSESLAAPQVGLCPQPVSESRSAPQVVQAARTPSSAEHPSTQPPRPPPAPRQPLDTPTSLPVASVLDLCDNVNASLQFILPNS